MIQKRGYWLYQEVELKETEKIHTVGNKHQSFRTEQGKHGVWSEQSCIQNQTTQWPSLRSRHLLLSSFFHFAVAKYTEAAACLLMKSHCGQSQQLVGGDFNINEYPTLNENMCASIHVCVRRNVTKRKKCECTYVCGYVYVVASVRVCVWWW